MHELRRRIRALVERIQAGEGAHVVADLGETIELWLTSGLLPLPGTLQPRAQKLGGLIGELADILTVCTDGPEADVAVAGEGNLSAIGRPDRLNRSRSVRKETNRRAVCPELGGGR